MRDSRINTLKGLNNGNVVICRFNTDWDYDNDSRKRTFCCDTKTIPFVVNKDYPDPHVKLAQDCKDCLFNKKQGLENGYRQSLRDLNEIIVQKT